MSRTITLSSPAMPMLLGEPALILNRIEGEEAFSTLYSYTLLVKTPANPLIPWQSASNVDIKALIGKEMTVSIELDGNGLRNSSGVGRGRRELSGLVEKARYKGRDANQALFEIVIRPWLWLTTLTTDFKIFQQKNVVEIIEDVLADYAFSFEKRLTARYPTLDYQVQYGETDFDFIERLMEEWGIYWFYEHQEQKHKLILVDHVGAHKASDSAAYHVIDYLPDEPKADAEYIAVFEHQEMLTSGRWVTNDYDFTKSRADILSVDVKARKTSFNDMEVFHWPGDYEQPAIGEQLARIRAEERGCRGSRSSGSGELRGIVCGTRFSLVGYPVEKVNREYMVISSALQIQEINQVTNEATYSVDCQFSVQPTSKIYRQPQTVRKPRTYGPQNAIVVGPEGEEVWTDEYGRVKVRFTWDRYGVNRESDSCWLRVSQAWAGNQFGGIYIPRIGHEVIVDFINGDPDRPLIMGNLYNNVTLPPWDLPVNATQSGLISRTIGGGKANYNGVRFEDKPGQEYYWEQAERDMDRLTKRNETQTIGVDSDISVGSNRKLVVGTDYSKNVGANATYAIGSNSSLQIGANSDVIVGSSYSKTVASAYTKMIGSSASVQVGSTYSMSVAAAHSTNVGGAKMVNVGGAMLTNVGGAHMISVGGAATLAVGGIVSIGAGGEAILTANTVKIVGKSRVVIQGGIVEINPGDCAAVAGGGLGLASLAGLAGLGGLIKARPILGCIALPLPLPVLPVWPPTQTPEPTPTPEPTSTPEPTPTPTETPTPTPTETPTPTPTGSATPEP
ncbi:type VI secretion system tip protein VgrG [Pantoea dispersa]|uniref:type VI secretion system Vgr family protein n=1 Tax=Pantoea dispersa TaxID=59814 RepID=UPI0021AEEDD1|nr:type VI secretion system tip protein TssI/VgrG [Pantoea dispersa]MCT6588466.1 type VI secretion system tip protein VgrG [Pantoea dispersa]